MSLYYEGSKFIANSNKQKGTLKRRVFADKNLKSNPAQVYGLVLEASRYAEILKDVIEKSDLLTAERKLTPELALLLVHDLLLSKKGIAAPQGHKLRASIEKHKTRLNAELTRYRLRNGFASITELKASVKDADLEGSGEGTRSSSPRWVRINRLKTTLDEQLRTTFKDYTRAPLHGLLDRATDARAKTLYQDEEIPDLIAVPPGLDLSREQAYLEGKLILQDKASCFPAYLLNPDEDDQLIVDACAAPGNKTTHLASLISSLTDTQGSQQQQQQQRTIIACERDKARAEVLKKMVKTAGADAIATVKAGQDFLRIDVSREPWCNATALLLDPSCSGSGIIGRDDTPGKIPLPILPPTSSATVSKKRKRGKGDAAAKDESNVHEPNKLGDDDQEDQVESGNISPERLASLCAFQTRLVEHAFSFPKARKVTYSTCSIYEEENENVVAAVLRSEVAKRRGWRILERSEQVEGMKNWSVRGHFSEAFSPEFSAVTADACIRCEKHTGKGTQGFFVVAFVRDDESGENLDEGSGKDMETEEWSGFDD